MITSTDEEKAFDKIQHPLWFLKSSQQSQYRGNVPQHNKGHIGQAHRWYHTQQWKAESFSLRSGTKQGCPFLPFLCNIVLEVLARTIRHEK